METVSGDLLKVKWKGMEDTAFWMLELYWIGP